MKRILHVVESLNRNGTETLIANVFRQMDHSLFMFDFLIFKDSHNGFEEEFKKEGSKIFRLPHRKEGIVGYHKNLDYFFKEHAADYEIIHMHGLSYTSLAPLVYARKHGVPRRIFHLHSNNCTGFHNKLLHRINRLRISGLATDVLACGQSAFEWGKPLLQKNITFNIIPNGIDLERFRFSDNSRQQLRREMGIFSDTLVIGNIGNFIPAKNHSFLITLMEKMVEKNMKVKMLLVGDGFLLSEIREKVIQKGLQDNIFLPGRTLSPEKYYQVFDVFVMPSIHEGFPFVLLEAQASCLPIVASDKIPQETKLSDQFRFLSLDDPIEKWIETILKFIDFERENRSSSLALQTYSLKNTVSKLLKIYS